MTTIVQETIDHIRAKGKCMDEGLCIYWMKMEDGTENMCGVGKWMKNPKLAAEKTFPPIEDLTMYADDGNLYVQEGYDVVVEQLEEQLIPEAQGHPTYFWDLLQNFHDVGWTGNKLTANGRNMLDQLCKAMKIDRTQITI